MRIALVRQRYNPFGGAERFIERALAALERNGAEVTLITRDWAGEGRRVLRVDPPYVGSLWRDAGFARAARTAWMRAGFDLVQSHERIAGCDLYRAGDGVHRQWLELRLERMSALERSKIRANPYHRYVCRVERRMFEHERLRAVICNSQMVREDVLRHFKVELAKLHVIYNGVELDHFHPRHRAELRAQARHAFGCAPQDVLLAFVGSGFERKGLATAIEALARCRDARLKLVVAGRDGHAPRFAAQAAAAGVADRVRLAGGLQDVRPLYAAADCFILPTLYDPFPNAALEALAMGVPVIVSRRCGAAELVRPGENGWLCEPHDAAALAALLAAAADSIGKPEMAQAARATAEGFGIDAMAAKLTALYATLANRAA
ncbi:MAG TPA: glycosyltransferase family 4 protein [Burkholderiales bacterium]|nr:glycosyltransferase family 4 protein [Burkholderiales bacterium]